MKALCTADYVLYLLKEILVKVGCFVYIVISKGYDSKTCILSVLDRQVHVAYVFMNHELFLNRVATRKMYSSKFSKNSALYYYVYFHLVL